MEFYVVVLVDGVEWKRANIMKDGEPKIGETAKQLLNEWRSANPNEFAFDRLLIRIDKGPRNA